MTEERDRVIEGKEERQKELEKQDLDTSTAYTEEKDCFERVDEAKEERQKEIDKSSL